MQNAMRRAGSRVTSAADRRPHGLSNITYDYVDKLQALSCLVSQPHKFGLHLPVDTRYEPLVPLLMDPGLDSIDAFARAHGKDAQLLRALNPGFRGGRVVAGVPRLVLSPPGMDVAPAPVNASETPPAMLAMDAADEIEVAMLLDSALEPSVAEANGATPAPAPSLAGAIAEQVPEPVPQAVAAAQTALPTVGDAREPTAMNVAETAFADPPAPVHQVREGESLSSIAQYYHLSVEQIRRANKLDAKATVHPGQVLQLVP